MGFTVGKEHLQLATDGDVKIYKEERDAVFPGNTAESREIYVCFDVHVTFWSTTARNMTNHFESSKSKVPQCKAIMSSIWGLLGTLSCMSHPNITLKVNQFVPQNPTGYLQKPKPDFAADRNFSFDIIFPRMTPSASIPATLTLVSFTSSISSSSSAVKAMMTRSIGDRRYGTRKTKVSEARTKCS